jgi:hypothetical protein
MKISIILLFSCLSLSLFARGNYNVLPTSSFFPTPNGILFPNITTAGGVNSAALPLAGKATNFQWTYGRAGKNGPDEFFGGVGMTSKKFGVSLGYVGNRFGDTLINNTYAGAGFAVESVSLGINARRHDWSRNNTSTDVDLGIIVGSGKGFTWGLVIYNINGTARLDGGVGFGGGKKYNMELNVLLPASGSDVYAITAAGTINPSDIFGVHFKTTYFSDTAYQHVLGASIFLSDTVGVLVQFTSPTTWTGGLNIAF